MVAYANPSFDNINDLKKNQRDPEAMLGDGYDLVRFNKKPRETVFECWPRYADLEKGDAAQYPGWPVRFPMSENDGRKVNGYLPEIAVTNVVNPVIQVLDEGKGEVLYTLRIQGSRFRPHVYGPGKYTVKVGREKPDGWSTSGLEPNVEGAKLLEVRLN
jgi:hypothetical protein